MYITFMFLADTCNQHCFAVKLYVSAGHAFSGNRTNGILFLPIWNHCSDDLMSWKCGNKTTTYENLQSFTFSIAACFYQKQQK